MNCKCISAQGLFTVFFIVLLCKYQDQYYFFSQPHSLVIEVANELPEIKVVDYGMSLKSSLNYPVTVNVTDNSRAKFIIKTHLLL